MRRAAHRASRVIAVSQFVRTYLSDTLHVPSEKIGVVYHGTELSHDEAPQRPAHIPDNWRGKFAFVAGSVYPYRGLEDVILAWDRMGHSTICPFVAIAGFVGHGMKRYYEHLKALLHSRKLDSQIHFIGALSKAEMAWCYENCAAFVMTSRVEACPNIALEAMAHGCLCVSTDNPPMPEIFGDAARYYPAGDAVVLAQRVLDVLQLPSGRQEQAKRLAIARAAKFSWEACCNQTVRELQKVLTQ